MNKAEFITYLRNPEKLTKEELAKLEDIVNNYPYFLSARLLLAKVSKEHAHPETKKRIASAAIYSTDRVLLKKYLSGNLFFLSKPPKVSKDLKAAPKSAAPEEIPIRKKSEEKPTPEHKSVGKQANTEQAKKEKPKQTITNKAQQLPLKKEGKNQRPVSRKPSPEIKSQPSIPDLPGGELDSILEELMRDMENLKKSRAKFTQVQQNIEEDDAVSEALMKASSKTVEPTEKEIIEEPSISNEEPIKETSEPKEKQAPESSEVKEKLIAKTEEKKTPSKTVTEDISEVKEIEKSHTGKIAEQALEAAKRAREEVTKEEEKKESISKEESKAKAEKAEKEEKSKIIEEEETTSSKEELKEPEKEEETTSSKKELKESKKVSSPNEQSSSDSEERAERVIREPRFSRFSSRSYISNEKKDIPLDEITDLDSSEEKEPVKVEPQEVKEEKPEVKPSNESDDSGENEDKIILPDLSKAKPVARKNPRKPKKEPLKKSSKEDNTKEVKKVEQEKKENKDDKKAAITQPSDKFPKKEKPVAKKTPTKKTAKTAEKKPSKKEKTVNKAGKEKAGKRDTKKDSGSKDDDKPGQKDLIDKFIEKSPSIKYKRTEDIKSENLAESSSEWDPNLASEYLAEIYLHQGNKKRAIEIYEALSLKYPEKKSYFADLISKID